MALNFPSSPTNGQQYVSPTGVIYTYSASIGAWTAGTSGGGGGGSVAPASNAEAAAGILDSKYSSPATAIPKDAPGMTGAGIIPSGTTAQRPSTPVLGMIRANTSLAVSGLSGPQLEFYNGTDWVPVSNQTSVFSDPINWFPHPVSP